MCVCVCVCVRERERERERERVSVSVCVYCCVQVVYSSAPLMPAHPLFRTILAIFVRNNLICSPTLVDNLELERWDPENSLLLAI